MRQEILRLEKIVTAENGVMLLNHFNLHIFRGEIMGLIAISRHGLESLIELICRNVPLYYGSVYFDEKLVNSYALSPLTRNKVAVIEKQFSLIENLTVADNIYVMRRGFKKYIIHSKTLNSQFKMFAMDAGVDLHGEQQVQGLTYYEKCVVELLKAIIGGVKLVIIRDISNFISTTDLIKFHQLMQTYTGSGVSFLYICNHHQEAYSICDKICLMENGKALKVLGKDEFKEEKILPFTNEFYKNYHERQALPQWMNDFPWVYRGKKGEGFDNEKPQTPLKNGQRVLEFCNVSSGNINKLTFDVKAGECVVLLDKNNTVYIDILALMNFERKPQQGQILLNGEVLAKKAFQTLGFIPEKPIRNLLFKEMSYFDNMCFTADKKLRPFWMRSAIRKSIVKEYEPIIGPDIHARDITKLSIQSLYSLVYYRIHLQNPKVVICVNPFFEGDMAMRLQIRNLIKMLLDKKMAVLILAVNLSDSLLIADRLLVLEKGTLINELYSGEYHKLTENPQ
ncbi:monosaccharide ABC transporter ATP-binding protein (CUT2 family) [Hydrogenispora ethanolica]|uniref:Monosaccharide ABC transporter ATP-binding protein (CUT2 family) n=1 Tax=Hydrogenispora ethanolica TaxID=1082276 RepID=A0A4R1RVE0_HYDET|nr:monosaccharide ABC transporter ATP-binding protein (CUT2 family) [Hydrogenispora ethanolica]